jgi:hypothetical protein
LDPAILGEEISSWIPKLTANFYSQARKGVGSNKPTVVVPTTRLGDRQLDSKGSSESPSHLNLAVHADHSAFSLLHSLVTTCVTGNSSDILCNEYNFTECQVNDGELFCAKIKDLTLDMQKIVDALTPTLKKIVSVSPDDEDGYLDKVVDPALLVLDKRLPGISDIMEKKITVLDIAEAFLGAKSGAPTVRLIIKIYKSIKEFVTRYCLFFACEAGFH